MSDTGAGPDSAVGEDSTAVLRILVVDDQALMRSGFSMMLGVEPDLEVIGDAADGAEAVEMCRRLRPDVVLMDVQMPGTDGIEATRLITAEALSKVLILTTFDRDDYLFDALRAGASGFLLKDAPSSALLSAIRSVHSGDAVVAPSATRRLLDRFADHLPGGEEDRHGSLDSLTPREREVLVLMARGYSNSEIAGRLYVSETTVKTHVRRILTKLDLRDRVQSVVLAYEVGLIEPGGGGRVSGRRVGPGEPPHRPPARP